MAQAISPVSQLTQGKIVQCIGAVVDVEFPRDRMPKIYDALKLEGTALTLEVQQQLEIRPWQPETDFSAGVQPGQHHTLATFGVVDLLIFRGAVPVAEVEVFGQTWPAGFLPVIVVGARQR